MRKHIDKKTLWVRIICGALVFIMLISAAYAAIMSIVIDVSASPNIKDYAINADTNANIYVSVGIIYGDEAEASPLASTDTGFVIGEAVVGRNERKFKPYILADGVKNIAVSPLKFLSWQNGRYLPASTAEASVNPYRVEVSLPGKNVWDIEDKIRSLVPKTAELFSVKGITGGEKVLKFGNFSDASTASSVAGEFKALLTSVSGINVTIYIPSGTGICLYNADNGEILFEFDSEDPDYMPAIFPLKDSSGAVGATLLSSENKYHDAILFSREGDNSINTLNLVELNTYIEGVLPSEIYTSWPIEVQKAFAIICRSMTVGFLCGKHYKYYNIDVCDTACCQAYRGRSRTTAISNDAVRSTGYNVITVNGRIATAYYTAVNGGESILMNHAWGGSNLPHIMSQKTPWEQYTTYIKNRGFWFDEYTPNQLKNQIRSKGYTDVKQPIASVEVTERAGETNYVYSLKYTDTAGNVQVINRTSKNYGALGTNVKSANFNIGKGSVGYHLDTVLATTVQRNSGSGSAASVFNVQTENGIFSSAASDAKVVTENGLFSLAANALNILTADGLATLIQSGSSFVPPAENGKFTAVNVYDDTVITTQLEREYLTYTASSPENFVIAGKGWGHGIGLSQYGANDLAKAGAEYDQIIKAYYKDTVIMTIRQLRGLE